MSAQPRPHTSGVPADQADDISIDVHVDGDAADRTEDKDALEREIEETRDALVDTVEAIVERVDPHLVAERNIEQVKRNAQRAAEDAQVKAQELTHQAQQTAQELAHQAQQTAERVQHEAVAFVEEDPDRAKMIAAGLLALIVGIILLRRRNRE